MAGTKRAGIVCLAVLCVCLAMGAKVVTAAGWAQGEPDISLSLAGCMDFESSQVVTRMAMDVRSGEDMHSLAHARTRALDAGAHANEMRRCYLAAQDEASDFDRDGVIGHDMTIIEDNLRGMYNMLGAFAPGDTTVPAGTDHAFYRYASAMTASHELSERLSSIIAARYL